MVNPEWQICHYCVFLEWTGNIFTCILDDALTDLNDHCDAYVGHRVFSIANSESSSYGYSHYISHEISAHEKAEAIVKKIRDKTETAKTEEILPIYFLLITGVELWTYASQVLNLH